MTTFSMPIVLDPETQIMSWARPYGVKGVSLGGCVKINYKGTKTAMRRSGHAHWYRKRYMDWIRQHNPSELEHIGWICIKSTRIEKVLTKNWKPTQLLWHEIAHIYRKSWTEAECDKWAWQKLRTT